MHCTENFYANIEIRRMRLVLPLLAGRWWPQTTGFGRQGLTGHKWPLTTDRLLPQTTGRWWPKRRVVGDHKRRVVDEPKRRVVSDHKRRVVGDHKHWVVSDHKRRAYGTTSDGSLMTTNDASLVTRNEASLSVVMPFRVFLVINQMKKYYAEPASVRFLKSEGCCLIKYS